MSRRTDDELRELITLWPTNSVSQIAKRLHRQISAVRSKAKRLRLPGLPTHNPEHFDVYPPKRARRKIRSTADTTARDAALFNPRARSHALPLAARRARRFCTVLRRTPGTGSSLLPAPSADGVATGASPSRSKKARQTGRARRARMLK